MYIFTNVYTNTNTNMCVLYTLKWIVGMSLSMLCMCASVNIYMGQKRITFGVLNVNAYTRAASAELSCFAVPCWLSDVHVAAFWVLPAYAFIYSRINCAYDIRASMHNNLDSLTPFNIKCQYVYMYLWHMDITLCARNVCNKLG